MLRGELLAPAGNEECLRAAVAAGADAVYLGAEEFNARRGAGNFTLDGLAKACDFAHLRGTLVYLTLNTAVLPAEAGSAMELARQAWRRGVDAFIVQDIGLASEIARTLPDVRLHASTQMNTHTRAGIEAAAALGASRVTLARELSLEEIALLSDAARELGMEVETFVHGALCVCYSGQCLMSSMVGGRSANRGLCAQACRLPYELRNAAQRKPLDSPGEHLLSPKDLCAIDLLPQLLAAGVASFKIEGRMKSADYVRTVVSVYRRALDAALEAAEGGSAYEVPERDKHELAEAFSRGFTTAYLTHERGNSIMSYGRPNNRGVFVGRVSGVRNGEVELAAEEEISEGDVLEFWTNKGHFAHTVRGLSRRVGKASGATGKGALYLLTLDEGQRANKGDRVFRVRRAGGGEEADPLAPRIPVTGSATLRIGEPLRIEFFGPGGISAFAEGPVIEPARTKPVSQEEVAEHIDRLGNLPFTLESLEVEVDEGAGIGFSQLHKVRTRALSNLEEALLDPWRGRLLERVEPRPLMPVRREGAPAVVAFATNPACARAAKKAGAAVVYVSALHYRRGEAMIAGQISGTAEQAGYPKQAVMALPAVEHDRAGGSREEVAGFDAWKYVREGKPVFVDNLGQLVRAAEEGALPELGPHVPVTNELALEAACALGAQRVWLSPELTLAQIEKLAAATPVPLGIAVMGAQELMVTEHCLLMSQGPCNENCAECARRRSPHFLKDRKGFEMPVVTDCCGRSHLYNAVPLDIVHALPELITAGVTAFMVDTSLMNVAQTKEAVARAVRACRLATSGAGRLPKAEGATSGHLYRGVQ